MGPNQYSPPHSDPNLVVETGQLSFVEAEHMSAVETGLVSAFETLQMFSVETNQMSPGRRGRCPVSRLYMCRVPPKDMFLVAAKAFVLSQQQQQQTPGA